MLNPAHDLHRRRWGRNAALGGLLAGFVLLVFAVTIVKMTQGHSMKAFDHTYRPELVTQP